MVSWGPRGGRGPILLIHGLGGRAETWAPLARRLASRGYRVAAPDLPGFGESKAPDALPASPTRYYAEVVLDIAGALGPAPVIGGFSYGGVVALEAYSLKPGGFGGLILVGAAHRVGARESMRLRAERAISEGMDAVAGEALRDLLGPQAPDALARAVASSIRSMDPRLYRAVIEDSVDRDYSWLLPYISTPAAVIVGEMDRLVDPGLAEEACNSMPDCSLYVIRGAGHMILLESPGDVATAIVEWLESRGL